ncbi:MAG: hypothetical protein ACE5HE_09180 [Phycisphaerae bacterium]
MPPNDRKRITCGGYRTARELEFSAAVVVICIVVGLVVCLVAAVGQCTG